MWPRRQTDAVIDAAVDAEVGRPPDDEAKTTDASVTKAEEVDSRSSAIVPVLVVALACGDSTGPESVMGTYALRGVDGSALPYLILESTSIGQDSITGQILYVDLTVHLISGSLRLYEDSTYNMTVTHRLTTDFINQLGELLRTTVTTLGPDTTLGTFAVTGTSIQLTSSSGVVTTGSHSGHIITFVWSGLFCVYER